MLVAMGFTANAAKRALGKYQDNLEAASNWIMENMDNYEINKPLDEEKPQTAPSFNQDALNQILEFGFSLEQAQVALLKNVLPLLFSSTTHRRQLSGCAVSMVTFPPSSLSFLPVRSSNRKSTRNQPTWTTN